MTEGLNTIPKKPTFLKRFVKFIGIFIGLCSTLCIGLVSLLFMYENEVKAIVIKELNKNLQAEVKVDPKNIDLTILKTFPFCSIEFRNVLMLEAVKEKKKDTLLYADQLNLYFNIRNLWEGKYEIEKIRVNTGFLNIKLFKDGSDNYHFWKSSDKNQEVSDSLNFHLQSIETKNLRLRYTDFKSEIFVNSILHDSKFAGNFYEHSYDLDLKTRSRIFTIQQSGSSYLKTKTANLRLN